MFPFHRMQPPASGASDLMLFGLPHAAEASFSWEGGPRIQPCPYTALTPPPPLVPGQGKMAAPKPTPKLSGKNTPSPCLQGGCIFHCNIWGNN